MTRTQRQPAQGKVQPVLIAAIILGIAAASVGAWYFLRGDPNPLGDDVQVTIDGKQVDASKVLKGGTIQLGNGGSFTFNKEGFKPNDLMAGVFKEYFDLPQGPARTKYLDDYIDQQEATRKQLGITTDAEGKPQVKVNSESGAPTTQPQKRIHIRAGSGAADSMPPELRAQIAEFVAAVNKRRAERGLPPQQGMMMLRTNKSQ